MNALKRRQRDEWLGERERRLWHLLEDGDAPAKVAYFRLVGTRF